MVNSIPIKLLFNKVIQTQSGSGTGRTSEVLATIWVVGIGCLFTVSSNCRYMVHLLTYIYFTIHNKKVRRKTIESKLKGVVFKKRKLKKKKKKNRRAGTAVSKDLTSFAATPPESLSLGTLGSSSIAALSDEARLASVTLLPPHSHRTPVHPMIHLL